MIQFLNAVMFHSIGVMASTYEFLGDTVEKISVQGCTKAWGLKGSFYLRDRDVM